MALTLEAFRNINFTGKVSLSADGQGLGKATFKHRLRTYFNIGGARAENANMLNDLKKAIFQDPRFFAVHDEINRMVGGIRTDRTITVEAVRSLLDRAERLVTPERQRSDFCERVRMHLASRGVPDAFAGREVDYSRAAVSYLLRQVDSKRLQYGQANISQMLNEFTERVENSTKADLYGFVPELLSSDDIRQVIEDKLSRILDEGKLTHDERLAYDSLATALRDRGVSAAEIVSQLENPESQVMRLLGCPSLCKTADDAKAALDMIKGLDAALAAKNPTGDSTVSKHCLEVSKMLLDELATMPEGKRPGDMTAYVNQHPLVKAAVDLTGARSILKEGEPMMRMRLMNPHQRLVFLSALAAFDYSTDATLMQLVCEHCKALEELYDADKLDRGSAYKVFTGKDELPQELADGQVGASVRDYFNNTLDTRIMAALADAGLDMQSYGPVMGLYLTGGFTLESAVLSAKGDHSRKPDLRPDPFRPSGIFRAGSTLETVEGELALDLNRLNYPYVVMKDPQAVCDVPEGGTFVFKSADGREDTVHSEELANGLSAKQKQQYSRGEKSDVSATLREKVRQMCGLHPEQAKIVLISLSQCSMNQLKYEAPQHGVSASEHSPAVWTLERRQNGDVAVTVSQPENCPLNFHWTYVIAPDGRQHQEGEPFMELAK